MRLAALLLAMPVSCYGIEANSCFLTGEINGHDVRLDYIGEDDDSHSVYGRPGDSTYGYCAIFTNHPPLDSNRQHERIESLRCSDREGGHGETAYYERVDSAFVCSGSKCSKEVVERFTLRCGAGERAPGKSSAGTPTTSDRARPTALPRGLDLVVIAAGFASAMLILLSPALGIVHWRIRRREVRRFMWRIYLWSLGVSELILLTFHITTRGISAGLDFFLLWQIWGPLLLLGYKGSF